MRTINKIIVFCIVILNFSCEDVFEENITDEIVQIISPNEGQQIESNVANFNWNTIEGAKKYRLQIFDQNRTIVLDSLTDKTNLKFPLDEGSYKWRVRGENFAYASTYSFEAGFSIFISSDLTNQQVLLSSPQNEVYLNFKDITLNWFSIPNATSYSVVVIDVISGQQIFTNTEPIIGTSVNFSVPDLNDRKYEWRLKAKNDLSETKQFSSRIFYLDTAPPNQVSNQTPANNSIQTISQELNFTWTASINSGSFQAPISYKIEFSNDVNFTTITQTFNPSSTTLKQNFNNSGIYFWRVIAVDQAGNSSVANTLFKFTIN